MAEQSTRHEPSAGVGSAPESLLNAAELFQSQLDQLTQWKQQLAQQVEALRRDSIKAVEQQKSLAQEKERFEQQQAALRSEQERIAAAAEQVKQQSDQAAARAAELEKAQQRNHAAVEAARQQLNAVEQELTGREKTLTEREAHCLREDVRLKEALEQLEGERRQLAEAQQQAAQQRDGVAAQARQLEEERQSIHKQKQDLQKRLESLEAENTEQLEALAKQSKRLAERRAELDATGADVEKAIAARVAEATEALQHELTRDKGHKEQQANELAQLRQQAQERESSAGSSKAREAQLQQELEAANQQLQSAKQTLTRIRGEREQARQKCTELQARLDSASSVSGVAVGGSDETRALAEKVAMLEKQRDDLAAQVFAAQEASTKQAEEALLAKNAAEAKAAELEQRNTALEGQISKWKAQAKAGAKGGDKGGSAAATALHRERLLRQAKAIRAFRREAREERESMEQSRVEVAQQREQIRARKENLEQVKRLLEKQEMVMARKLASHNAFKTVAAVGIFVIMVLGGAFYGVYRFVSPVYRGEAIVQLAPPANMPAAELDAWAGTQREFIKSQEVTAAAWNILRSVDVHYAMHDVREEWVLSLPKHLSLIQNGAALSIQYTGPSSQGVADVCNALATAYSMPGMRQTTQQTLQVGNGSVITARAAAAAWPVEDKRLTFSLLTVAIVLFASLVLVIVFRHFVARQLKEIDHMAEEQELAEIQAELPADAKPA